MGTLGSDFLSSLPLHEYPPAFPLGADIQGITHILSGWVGSRPVTPSLDLFLCGAWVGGCFLVVKELEGG